jgi:hypothetical protein
VAESSPGEYEPLGRRRTHVPGGGLAGLFGVREIESTSTPLSNIRIGDVSLAVAWQRAELAVTSAEIVAKFDDGAPAATAHHYGSGTAVLLGSFASVAAHRASFPGSPQALRTLLGMEDIAPGWVRHKPGLVSRAATTANGRDLLFLLNWTRDEAGYHVPWAATVLAAGPNGVPGASAAEEDSKVSVPARRALLLLAADD